MGPRNDKSLSVSAWLYPPFPVACPFRFTIALLHPLPHQTVRSVFPNTAFRSSSSNGFRIPCLAFWYSSLRGFRDTMEFTALTAISFLPLFGNTMKALPLPSPKVMLSLRFYRYYGQLPLPCRPDGISSSYIHPLLSCAAFVRASRATSYGLPCVVRIEIRRAQL